MLPGKFITSLLLQLKVQVVGAAPPGQAPDKKLRVLRINTAKKTFYFTGIESRVAMFEEALLEEVIKKQMPGIYYTSFFR